MVEENKTAGLRVATYNIHRAVGADGRKDLERVARVVAALDADVVGLQEVDSNMRTAGAVDQLQFLARNTGMTPIAGAAWAREYGDYGNGLLTRCPVVGVRRHDVSVASHEPRSLLEVRLETRLGPLRVVNTHFGTRNSERRRQHELLVSLIRSVNGGPLVVMGDFNEWSPLSGTTRTLDRLLGRAPRVRSFPSRLPLFSLDRVWARSPCRVTGMRAVRDGMARVASDHLPVVASVRPARSRAPGQSG
jgi:endonuclease/exonuclease/phosphatase family metal-dependent hydrolase